MKLEMSSYDPMLGTTTISDLFFSRYLPLLDGESVKVYLYLYYMFGKEKEIDIEEIALTLGTTEGELKAKIIELQQAKLLNFYDSKIQFVNLGADELKRTYRVKTTGDMDSEVPETARTDEKYKRIKKTISDRFYGGHMPTGVFTDIDKMVNMYSFEPETLFLLFQHCKDHNKDGLVPAYVAKVAESWGKQHIVTAEQAMRYLDDYTKFKEYREAIKKCLGIREQLDIYKEETVRKWYGEYKISIDCINYAVSKTTVTGNLWGWLSRKMEEWHSSGLQSLEDVKKYTEEKEKGFENKKNREPKQAGKSNYKERQYDDNFFDQFIGGPKND